MTNKQIVTRYMSIMLPQALFDLSGICLILERLKIDTNSFTSH